jgi:hypothetical protein
MNPDKSLRKKKQEKVRNRLLLKHGAEHSPQWRHKLWHPGKCRTGWCNSPPSPAGMCWGRPSGLHKQRAGNQSRATIFQRHRSRWLVGGENLHEQKQVTKIDNGSEI